MYGLSLSDNLFSKDVNIKCQRQGGLSYKVHIVIPFNG